MKQFRDTPWAFLLFTGPVPCSNVQEKRNVNTNYIRNATEHQTLFLKQEALLERE